MLNLIVIYCPSPVMLRIHAFFLPFRSFFFFPPHNFGFAERGNRRPCVLINIACMVVLVTVQACQCWSEQALEPEIPPYPAIVAACMAKTHSE